LFALSSAQAGPLHDAASAGDLDRVKRILARHASIDVKDVHSFTALHLSADKGHRGVVELLLVEGADVNAKDKYGQTPLLLAAYEGHIAVVERLIGTIKNECTRQLLAPYRREQFSTGAVAVRRAVQPGSSE
jgi:ankyrin repeat protein